MRRLKNTGSVTLRYQLGRAKFEHPAGGVIEVAHALADIALTRGMTLEECADPADVAPAAIELEPAEPAEEAEEEDGEAGPDVAGVVESLKAEGVTLPAKKKRGR
jgi:hypothetical protein